VEIDWAPEVVAAALDKDVTRDANGYVAPRSMLPR
jgi:hypothetical protein